MVPRRAPGVILTNTTLPQASSRPGWAIWVATCGGIGYFPVAPGSVGAAVAVAIVAALGRLPISSPEVSLWVGVVAAITLAVGIVTAGETERYFRRKDPGHIVIDEVLGQMVVLLAHPRAGWKALIVAFLLFRVFDVLKPFPARRLEHLNGGWGVMLDDAAAGVWSLLVFSLVGHWLR